MTRRVRAALLAPLLPGLLGGLLGCTPLRDPPRVDREQVVARDLALLHSFAVEAQEQTGVLCVEADLSRSGLPTLGPGYVVVSAVTEDLPVPAREALARSLTEQVWDLGLSDVVVLELTVGPATAGPDTSTDVGEVLRADGSSGAASTQDLEAAFGPPAPRATGAPPDPGPRSC